MSKGLDSLEEIKEFCDLFDDGCQWDETFSKQIDNKLNIIEKELKALEIIKKNILYIDWIWLFDCIVNNKSYEKYIDGCNATKETTIVSKEEYYLLKEVLTNGK